MSAGMKITFVLFLLLFLALVARELSWLPQYISISYRGRIRIALRPDWRQRFAISAIPLFFASFGLAIASFALLHR